MPGITDEKQYEKLSEDWRQIHNVIWQIPSVSLSIITGVVFVAYQYDGWSRVLALGIGSIFLFSMTVEIVKKRLTMDAVSYRMQRLELKFRSESNLSLGPFSTETLELMKERQTLADEILENEKGRKLKIEITEDPEGTKDPAYRLFKYSNARSCLTSVLFATAIAVSIATYWEFIRQMGFVWFSYWIGLIPVISFSSLFARVRLRQRGKWNSSE